MTIQVYYTYRPAKERTGHQQTIPYKTIQDNTGPHMTNHSRPYRTIQDRTYPIKDHTEPYQTTQGHTRPNKCSQSQKELCICESVSQSVKFTHIELPIQLKIRGAF